MFTPRSASGLLSHLMNGTAGTNGCVTNGWFRGAQVRCNVTWGCGFRRVCWHALGDLPACEDRGWNSQHGQCSVCGDNVPAVGGEEQVAETRVDVSGIQRRLNAH